MVAYSPISQLHYSGHLQAKRPAVLFIPGGMASSPLVFSGIEQAIPWQSAVIEYSISPGPWDVRVLGGRLLKFINEMQLSTTVIAGYSAGGVIAQAAAIEDSNDCIAGLLLSNTGPCAIGHGDPNLPKKIKEQWFSDTFYEQFLARCFSKPIGTELKTAFIEYAEKVDKKVVYEISKSLRQHDLRPLLKQITCPVVIAHGILDTGRTLDHVAMLMQGIKNSDCFLLHGGHTIMYEKRKHWSQILNYLIDNVVQ